MNRRGFLTTLAAALTGAVLDPERLLWVPGQKTIFIPSIEQTNTWLTPEATFSDGQLIASVWEEIVGKRPLDNIFESKALFTHMAVYEWSSSPA